MLGLEHCGAVAPRMKVGGERGIDLRASPSGANDPHCPLVRAARWRSDRRASCEYGCDVASPHATPTSEPARRATVCHRGSRLCTCGERVAAFETPFSDPMILFGFGRYRDQADSTERMAAPEPRCDVRRKYRHRVILTARNSRNSGLWGLSSFPREELRNTAWTYRSESNPYRRSFSCLDVCLPHRQLSLQHSLSRCPRLPPHRRRPSHVPSAGSPLRTAIRYRTTSPP